MPNDTPTITLNAVTPSAELIASALKEVVVTDVRGRAIKLRKPGVLAQYRLIEALGDVAQNPVYVGMVLPIIFVTEIDGDPVSPPRSKIQVEALISRLDEAGINAIAAAVQENFGVSADAEETKIAIKN